MINSTAEMASFNSNYLDLVSARRRGPLADVARVALALFSIPYGAVILLRNAFYDLFKRAAGRVGCPVISVGNITVGGTGKTPVAARIAGLLQDRGRRVAILLRGYKGRVIQFDMEQRDQAARTWRKESDEALVLRRRCPKATVLVDPDRLAAARRAVKQGADVLVLDDGFQHRRLARDLDIVLVDATAPFGFGHLLPRGLLREPIRSLRRADLIVLTRSDQLDETSRAWLLRRLHYASDNKPVIQAVHRIVGFTDVRGHDMPVDDPTAMQAVVFAGVANFEGFKCSVESLGVHILAAYQYPDHHDYTMTELDGLLDVSATLEANVILTTEKDVVKLVGRWNDQGCRLLALKLDVELVPPGETILLEAIDHVCAGPDP